MALLTTSLVSFAMLALAAALWLAATGRPFFDADAALAAAADPGAGPVLVLAVVLALAGIGFKLSLVPFHAWTPEAYDGAPAAGRGVPRRHLQGRRAGRAARRRAGGHPARGARSSSPWPSSPPLSMTLGNVMALRQDDVVRLLAWSTVAQAGWVVLPLAGACPRPAVRASGGYLLAYVVATLLAFAVVAASPACAARRRPAPSRRTARAAGPAARAPRAGVRPGPGPAVPGRLPPGLLGVVAKVVALRPVVADGLWVLAVVAAANAVLGVAVYLRWLRVLLGPVPGARTARSGPRRRPRRRPAGEARGALAPGPPRGARWRSA